MSLDDIDTIAVLGAGTMGHGIAEVAAISGYDVVLRDIEEELVEDGLEQIEWSLGKLVEHDRLSQDRADAARERITGVVAIEAAVGDADLVIEAVPERMDIKREVFEAVSEHAPERTIFTSNTSSLSITEIAEATDRPTRFCGMHFFNPPVRRHLVEVIAGERTDESVLETVEALADDMGKTAVRAHKDSPGFIVNRVLVPLMNEAAWMVHEDEATIEAVDATGKFGMGLPMGAFELSDLVGIDVAVDIGEYIHDQLGDAYEPCPLLREKVAANELGQKTGKGFYDHDNGGVSVSRDAQSDEIAERLLAVMANETAQLVTEGVADASAIDVALELGAAFPDGPATLADQHGLDALIDHLEDRYDETGAARYEVADGFREIAATGGFYGREGDEEETGFEALRIEYPGNHVGKIVIDRAHRMNAISPAVLDELPVAIEELEANDDVRAILLEGDGDRAFSAGADIQGMVAAWGDAREVSELSRRGQRAFGRLQECVMPVIAAIDGYCIGGGMELATAADLRIASERSTFSQSERDLGLLPGWGGTQRLAPIVGMGRAKEIVFTGERYDAREMERYGFVNEVYEADGFDERALAYAEDIASGPPIAFADAKRAMNLGAGDESAGLEIEASAFGQLAETDDLNEGISAFLEDREPEFKGK